MATDFDSNAIVTAGGIKPSSVDTPGDARTRVKLLEDIMTIPLPYLGMIVYCEETDCYYKITELGPKYIGNKEIENSLVEAYEEYDINMIVRGINSTYVKANAPVFNASLTLGSVGSNYDGRTRGSLSTCLGYLNQSSGNNSFAQGNYCEAGGSSSSAQGDHAEAYGDAAHAEGKSSSASGLASHAEGYNTKATSKYAHAEGWSVTASGINSHAEGYYCSAGGESSHAEGYHTETTATAAHAEGWYTIANCSQQHVQGKYNIVDEDNESAHIVGNGTNTKRSNAHTLDWSGNAWFAGYVSAPLNPFFEEFDSSRDMLNHYDALYTDDNLVCKKYVKAHLNEHYALIQGLMNTIESLQARIEELENK